MSLEPDWLWKFNRHLSLQLRFVELEITLISSKKVQTFDTYVNLEFLYSNRTLEYVRYIATASVT